MQTILALFAVASIYQSVPAAQELEENVYSVEDIMQWHADFENVVETACDYFDNSSNDALAVEVENAEDVLVTRLEPAMERYANSDERSDADKYIHDVFDKYIKVAGRIVNDTAYIRKTGGCGLCKGEKQATKSSAKDLERLYQKYMTKFA